MKQFTVIFIFLINTICVLGQASQSVKMNNNKISAEIIKPELKYIFPEFQRGRVVLKNMPEVKCQLNYNFLLDEILFINEKGEKMALANPDDISLIYIANRLFIPGLRGYCEVIERGEVSLIYKWTCNIQERGKEGAFGVTTDAPGVYQMNQMSFDAKQWKLDVDNEAVVSVEVIPYLRFKSKFIPVKGSKDFFKAFPGKKQGMKQYLNQNPVDFRKEADLRRLTQHCNSL